MRHLVVSICLVFLSSGISAQEGGFLSFELAGSGGFASLNYERPALVNTSGSYMLRFGFSIAPIDKNNGTNLVFPVMLHRLVGKNSHKLDLAVGQALSLTTKGNIFLSAPLGLGYRYQPTDKNHYFRISYTPLVSYLVDFQWQHWAGITYGIKLKGKK